MSIRDGFLVSTPLLIGGSIFLLIANFPIQGWINFLETTVVNSSTGQTLASFISKPAGATFDIMAIFAVIGIAYSFALPADRLRNKKRRKCGKEGGRPDHSGVSVDE